MKVLVITNLVPVSSNLNSGIFVVRRLREYKNFNVEYNTVSLYYENSIRFC